MNASLSVSSIKVGESQEPAKWNISLNDSSSSFYKATEVAFIAQIELIYNEAGLFYETIVILSFEPSTNTNFRFLSRLWKDISDEPGIKADYTINLVEIVSIADDVPDANVTAEVFSKVDEKVANAVTKLGTDQVLDNPKSNIQNIEVEKILQTTPQPPSPGLSAIEIAVIVIGSVIGTAAIFLSAGFYIRKQYRAKKNGYEDFPTSEIEERYFSNPTDLPVSTNGVDYMTQTQVEPSIYPNVSFFLL